MIPLSLLSEGDTGLVGRISGSPDVRKHLENLGFVVGSDIKVITKMGSNVIVQVKEARVAISRELTQRLMINI